MTSVNTASSAALHLRLYVAGDSPNSVAAERNLRSLLREHPALVFKLELVDVLSQPEAGLRAKILATPTLVRLAPLPERRILGNLQRRDLVRDMLGLCD